MQSGPEKAWSMWIHASQCPTYEDTWCVFWGYRSIHSPAGMTSGQGRGEEIDELSGTARLARHHSPSFTCMFKMHVSRMCKSRAFV